jgi:hypothetical protein
MTTLDEHGQPIIHAEPFDMRGERQRWVTVLDPSGAPQSLLQEYEKRGAHLSGAPHVRRGRTVPPEEFYTAEIPNDVRAKIYRFLQKLDAPKPGPRSP